MVPHEVEITVLGSGGWFATHRHTTSVLVRTPTGSLLLDAGTGAGLAAAGAAGPLGRNVHVVLTHFHLDHVIGLACLPALGADTRIEVWGPGRVLGSATEAILDGLFATPLFPTPLRSFIADVHELDVGANDIGGTQIDVRHQERHPGGSVGLRIGDFAFITDTEPDPGTVDFVAGCGILMHEAWQAVQPVPGHSAAREVAQLASLAQVGSLVLSHVHPLQDAPEALLAAAQPTFPATRVASDLLRLG